MAGLRRAMAASRRGLARLTRTLWLASGLIVFGGAVLLGVAQPDSNKADAAVILALGSLLGLSLSVGAAVVLLIAQQLAERYPRPIFREFRRDRNWALIVALATAGVLWSAGGALWKPTVSTAWSAWLSLLGVLLLAASRLPGLLDSLDSEVLSNRVASRAMRRLKSKQTAAGAATEFREGVESLSALARQAILRDDPKVITAALNGVNGLLAEYVPSGAYGGIDDPNVDFAMQRYEIVALSALGTSRVVALPAVTDALEKLGEAAAHFRLPLNPNWEAVTDRTANLLRDIAAASLRDQLSWSASMATAAIANNSERLIHEGRTRAIASHIRHLRQIGEGGVASGAFHMSAQATHGLARVALALLEGGGTDIMGPSYFEEVAEGLTAISAAYLAANVGAWGAADSAVLPIVGPLATPNLAGLAVRGLDTSTSWRGRRARGDFARGADEMFRCALQLAFPASRRHPVRQEVWMVVDFVTAP